MVRALPAFPEDPNSVPSAHIRWLQLLPPHSPELVCLYFCHTGGDSPRKANNISIPGKSITFYFCLFLVWIGFSS